MIKDFKDFKVLAAYVAGDFFAYTSLVLRRPRRITSFVATEACEFRVVARDAFLRWLDDDEDLREKSPRTRRRLKKTSQSALMK